MIYPGTEEFPIGGSKVLRRSPHDRFALVAAGITVHESLAAWEALKKRGVAIGVIDAYSVKPLDAGTLLTAARETECLVVVEDHARGAGWCQPIDSPYSLTKAFGRSAELLDRLGISRHAIEQHAARLAA